MEKKPTIKFFVDESIKGNFSTVHNNLIVKRVDLDTRNSIKILGGVSLACHEDSTGKLSDTDLVNLVKLLVKFIQVPTDELYDHYSRSAFHILKYLIDKKSFQYILDLEFLLIPEFMPLILNEKHLSVYQSICRVIYNVIIQAAQNNNRSQTASILKLSYLLFKLYKKLDLKNKAFEVAHNCLWALIALDVVPENLVKFYTFTLTEKIDPALFPPLMNNLSMIYTHTLKCENFALASQCYHATSLLVKAINGKEFPILGEILKIIEWLNPANIDSMTPQTPERAHENLRTYYKFYNNFASLQAVCDIISSVAYMVQQYYKKKNYWIEKVEVHGHFYKFLSDVALIMSKTSYSCPCKCSCETNLNEALRTMNSLGGLGKLCILNAEVTRSYKFEIYKYLEKHVDYVRVLKGKKCQKWLNHWYDAAAHLYAIGIICHTKKDAEMLVLFLRKFVHTLIEFEGFNPKKVEKPFLIRSLYSISDSYFENREFEKCMLVTSLSIIVSDTPKGEGNTWLRAKNEARYKTIDENVDLQKLTLVSIHQKYETELAAFVPGGLQLDTNRKIDLLVFELKLYSSKWKSKVPMCAAFKELTSYAGTQLLADVFIDVWGDGDLAVDEELPPVLQDLIRRVEKDEVPRKGLILAHLYFLQHRYRVKDTIEKHCDEMERTLNMTKVNNEIVDGVVPDPNADCDLVSSYECLKLSRYVAMMKELNKSFDLLLGFLPKNVEKSERLFKLLSNIAHEFSLHCDAVKSLQAWKLALKVAESPLQILEATGFLIEQSDVRKSEVKKLIANAESHLDSIKNCEELVVYLLCKAEAYFHVDFETSYRTFRQALRLPQDSDMIKARIYLLHHKFIMLPCHYKVDEHKEYSLVKIHQANNSVTSHYNEAPSTTSYDMRIFFEVYDALARMYHDLRLPREVRCYAKDVVVIAQKMVLPMRTLSLLYYLTYADINTSRLDGSRVKIKDMCDILGLGQKSLVTPVVRAEKNILKEIENLGNFFGELMLDVPQTAKSSGSPTFAAETFKLPQFLSHREDCTCYYCTCVEYHLFVLKKTYLNALLCEHEGQILAAKDFFFGCLKIYDILEDRVELYLKKTGIAEDLVPSPLQKIREIYLMCLLQYGNFLLRNKQVPDADTLNSRLLQRIDPYKTRYVYLYHEVLAQKLNIIAWKMIEPPKPKISPAVQSQSSDKTPPLNKLVLSPIGKPPKMIQCKRIQPKNLKFDLSDDEEDEPLKDTTSYKALPQFLNLGAKTPAPSSSAKIKIYDDNKSAKKALKISSEALFKEPSTPVVKVEKGDPNLASRTKLLTERLKNSSKKNEAKSAGGVKKSVRQNLFEASDEGGSGAVRRSARNRK